MNRAGAHVMVNLAVLLAYFVAAKLGLSLATINQSTTIVWPARARSCRRAAARVAGLSNSRPLQASVESAPITIAVALPRGSRVMPCCGARIAVVAGSTIVAEPERIAAAADGAKIFVIGVGADGTVR